jgi:hypothetical protein
MWLLKSDVKTNSETNILVNPNNKTALLLKDVCDRVRVTAKHDTKNDYGIDGNQASQIVTEFFSSYYIGNKGYTLLIPVSGTLKLKKDAHIQVLIAFQDDEGKICFRLFDPTGSKEKIKLVVNCRNIINLTNAEVHVIFKENKYDDCLPMSLEFISEVMTSQIENPKFTQSDARINYTETREYNKPTRYNPHLTIF